MQTFFRIQRKKSSPHCRRLIVLSPSCSVHQDPLLPKYGQCVSISLLLLASQLHLFYLGYFLIYTPIRRPSPFTDSLWVSLLVTKFDEFNGYPMFKNNNQLLIFLVRQGLAKTKWKGWGRKINLKSAQPIIKLFSTLTIEVGHRALLHNRIIFILPTIYNSNINYDHSNVRPLIILSFNSNKVNFKEALYCVRSLLETVEVAHVRLVKL